MNYDQNWERNAWPCQLKNMQKLSLWDHIAIINYKQAISNQQMDFTDMPTLVEALLKPPEAHAGCVIAE